MIHNKKYLCMMFGCLMAASITGLKAAPAAAVTIKTRYSLPLIGEAAYPEGFNCFNYVNPHAPKGGALKLAALGTYDTLNPHNGKGRPAEGLYLAYDRLMVRSADEPYTLYPLLAKSIQYPDSLEWVAFNLDPRARFHDGSAITADDVVFTFNLLKESGSTFIKNNYKEVLSVKAESPHRVVFQLGSGRGIKVIAFVAFLPVLAPHFWKKHSFVGGLTTLPLSSGPMKVTGVELGRSITYERVKDYWAESLPVCKGLHNFDTVRIDYYRDHHASIEAFRAGLYDFRYEFDVKSWHQNYQFPEVKKGDVIAETAPFLHPPGMHSFVFNTRKVIFQDIRVRQALLRLFDFEWVNKCLLYSEYRRTTSFFVNTPLAATGLPSMPERKLLDPFAKYLPAELFTQAPSLPVSAGTGNSRQCKQEVITLLKQAGWEFRNGKMIQLKTGKPMVFSLLLSSASDERVTTLFRKNLAEIGITMTQRTLDISQFQRRVKTFDFDMVNWHFINSPFPGSDQANSWSSSAADEPRSNNLAGVKNPAVDALTHRLSTAAKYEDIVDIVQALDRVLLWGCYVIPKWYSDKIHMIYRKTLKHPRTGKPLYPVMEAMWTDDGGL